MNHVTHPMSSDDIRMLHRISANILLYQEREIQIAFSYLVSISFNFF